MRIVEGFSQANNARAALDEATKTWDVGAQALNMILVFCSTEQDAGVVASELAQRYPSVPIAGCTTSGEHLAGRHLNGSLVLMGIESPRVRWATTSVSGLAQFGEQVASEAADRLFAQLGVSRDDVDPSKMFCLLFVDGLSRREEAVAAALAEAIEGVPLLGGSAGDDLHFERTEVIHDGQASSDTAVLVMGYSEQPFEIIKHQHFTETSRHLAITRADAAARRVYEIDGEPAAVAYARALGLERSQLSDAACFSNPVTFRCHGELYVRSIQKLEEDDSITFYCGIENGMVLDVGGHHDLVDALEADLSRWRQHGGVELLIGCNCILRALEAGQAHQHEDLGRLFKEVAAHNIGFDTYGEQLNGLHINQTLVALAFMKEAA